MRDRSPLFRLLPYRILPLLLGPLLLLSSCGGKSDDPVMALRKERDPGQRAATLRNLVKEKGPKAGDLWDRLLRESDPEIARLTASALGKAEGPGWRDPPAALLDSLLEAARRTEPQVRAEAVLAVALLYAEDPRMPPRLLFLLSDPEVRVRRAAVDAFDRFGPAAGAMDLAPLRALLRDPALSLHAAAALAACGAAPSAAMDRLVAAIEDRSDPSGARTAGAALVILGPRAGPAAARIAKVLPGSPPGVARDICDVLGFSATRDPAVAPALVKSLDSRDDEVRAAAALALVRMGKGEGAAAKILAGLAGSTSPEARLRSDEGLLLLGKGGAPEWESLTARAADPASDGLRAAAAVEAVGRVCAAGRKPAGASADVVEKASEDPRLPVRRAASRARAVIASGR